MTYCRDPAFYIFEVQVCSEFSILHVLGVGSACRSCYWGLDKSFGGANGDHPGLYSEGETPVIPGQLRIRYLNSYRSAFSSFK